MSDAKHDLVSLWLLKAQHDLAAAQKITSGEDTYLDVAIYHCQQAAEKALKGFLVFHDQRFEKTHDLGLLVDLAARFDPSFAQWLDAADQLTPYATAFRYPGEAIVPSADEFQKAVQAAGALLNFVLSRLPEGVHPVNDDADGSTV